MKNISKTITRTLIGIYTVAIALLCIELFVDVCELLDVGRALESCAGQTVLSLSEMFWQWIIEPYYTAIECGVLLIVAVNLLKALIAVYEWEA